MFALVRKTLALTLAVAIVPFALIYLLAPPLLPAILGGAHWQQAALFAAALTPWLYMNFSTSPISNLFVVTGRQGLMLMFAVVYMMVPLGIIWSWHDDMLATIRVVSWAQAGLLAMLCLLALWVAKDYDRGAPVEAPAN